MALEILQKHRKSIAALTLIPSVGGAFEVSIDGKKIYSKMATGVFPELKALQAEIQQALDGQ